MAGSVRLVCCRERLCTGFNKWTKISSVCFSTQAFKIKLFKPSSAKSWRSSWKITRILHAYMDLPWETAVHRGLSVLAWRPSQVCSCHCRERVLMKNIPCSFNFPWIPHGLGLNTQLFRSSCGVSTLAYSPIRPIPACSATFWTSQEYHCLFCNP